jgi:hypothetical protein
VCVCVCVCVCLYLYKKQKTATSRMARVHKNIAVGRRLVPEASAEGMRLSQALRDDTHRFPYLLSLLRVLGNLPDGKHSEIHESVGGLYDQRRQLPTSVTCSSLAPATHTCSSSSSAGRSHPSKECRSCACSSASITSRIFRSFYNKRRI